MLTRRAGWGVGANEVRGGGGGVHTQGGAHARRSVARAGVLLSKGGVWGLAPVSSEASRGAQSVWEGLAVHTQGGAYTRWCTHKVACSHRRSLVI